MAHRQGLPRGSPGSVDKNPTENFGVDFLKASAEAVGVDTRTARDISLFALLGDEELKRVLSIAHKIPFERNQEIIQQGQSHSCLYLVEEGVLHVSRNAERSQVFLGRIEKGGFFGEIGLFAPGPATA